MNLSPASPAAASQPGAPAHTPRLRRRIASGLYEAVLLFAVMFVPAYLFSALTQFKGTPGSSLRYAFQLFIFIVIGIYFVWCWRHGGQTLPMKTWRFRLVGIDGAPPSAAQCWLRYTCAWIGPVSGLLVYKLLITVSGFGTTRFSYAAFAASVPFLILNFIWAVADRDRQFLHDRLARTRLVMPV